MGMATKKIIVVPCMVMRRLKTCGGTRWLFGTTSCSRMTVAIEPATSRKRMPLTMYMMPSRLWSTVTTHPCRRVTRDGASATRPAAGNGRVGAAQATTAPRPARDPPGARGRRGRRGGRGPAGWGAVGSLPRAARFREFVRRRARPDRLAAHEMRQVGPEGAAGAGAPHRVAADAGGGLEHLATRLGPGIACRGL